MLASAFLAAVIALGLLAPWIAPYDPYDNNLRNMLKPPSAAFWLGNDGQGRDLLSRLLYGIRTTLTMGLLAVGIGGILLQDHAVVESMGSISDRTLEHLAPSDRMITETRRALLRAADAYAKDGTLPAAATDPSAFARTRGGAFFTEEGADWIEAYEEIMSAAPIASRIAAE